MQICNERSPRYAYVTWDGTNAQEILDVYISVGGLPDDIPHQVGESGALEVDYGLGWRPWVFAEQPLVVIGPFFGDEPLPGVTIEALTQEEFDARFSTA